MQGEQPDGKMTVQVIKQDCEGYNGVGTIVIDYTINSCQVNKTHISGIHRRAYLPNTPEGNEVLGLLQKCFDRKLTFTVGTSVTSGLANQVVWNGIHHKTSMTGGSSSYGYPDQTYLTRVKEELAAKGVK